MKEKDSWAGSVHGAHEVHYPRLSCENKSTLFTRVVHCTTCIKCTDSVYEGLAAKSGQKAVILRLEASRCGRQTFSLRPWVWGS